MTFIAKQVNILSMNSSFLNQKTPNEIAKSLADKIKEHRKRLKISQEVLAQNPELVLAALKDLKQNTRFLCNLLLKLLLLLI